MLTALASAAANATAFAALQAGYPTVFRRLTASQDIMTLQHSIRPSLLPCLLLGQCRTVADLGGLYWL